MRPTALAFDTIIIGGGAAGCAVASRLSSPPAHSVALIEAGRDYGATSEPPAVLDPYSRASSDPRFLWPGLSANLVRSPDGKTTRDGAFLQGQILGGGSSVMGMQALRGLPTDYDEWRELGATGWGWDDVRSYFLKLENDADFLSAEHGVSGPIPIYRLPSAEWPAFAKSIASAASRRGYALRHDANREHDDGLYPMPIAALPSRRVTSAAAYLDANVRQRTNLTIVDDARGHRLLFEGQQVTGVEIAVSGERMTLSARRQVILAAGAIQSPAILLRSGVGPAGDLGGLGIHVVRDLPGVGQNLQNHPILSVAARVKRRHRQSHRTRTHMHSFLRFSSGLPDCPASDMYMTIANKTAWHALGRSIAALSFSVYKPRSRGVVKLRTPHGDTDPQIDFSMLSDPLDLARMTSGLRLMIDLLNDPAVGHVISRSFIPSGSRAIRNLARPTIANAVLTAAVNGAMDCSDAIERRVIDLVGRSTSEVRDSTELERLALLHTSGMSHPAGTCKIGSPNDPSAVVDPRCRVIGLSGVRVIDASVMPTLPAANTFIPVTMIAERAADMVLADLR